MYILFRCVAYINQHSMRKGMIRKICCSKYVATSYWIVEVMQHTSTRLRDVGDSVFCWGYTGRHISRSIASYMQWFNYMCKTLLLPRISVVEGFTVTYVHIDMYIYICVHMYLLHLLTCIYLRWLGMSPTRATADRVGSLPLRGMQAQPSSSRLALLS